MSWQCIYSPAYYTCTIANYHSLVYWCTHPVNNHILTPTSVTSSVSDCWPESNEWSGWWLRKGVKTATRLRTYHRHSVPVCRVLNSASSSSSSCSVWLVCVKPFLLWRQHWWVAMSARWPWTSAVVRSPRSLMIRWQLEGNTWVVTVTLLRGF